MDRRGSSWFAWSSSSSVAVGWTRAAFEKILERRRAFKRSVEEVRRRRWVSGYYGVLTKNRNESAILSFPYIPTIQQYGRWREPR